MTIGDDAVRISKQGLSFDDVVQRLRSSGGRATSLRMRILQLLASTDEAFCVRDIEKALHTAESQYVTIYRVLHWLLDQGLVRRLIGPEGKWYFHADMGVETASFFCGDCSRVFPMPHHGRQQPPVLLPGFKAETGQYSIVGRCAECGNGGRRGQARKSGAGSRRKRQ